MTKTVESWEYVLPMTTETSNNPVQIELNLNTASFVTF